VPRASMEPPILTVCSYIFPNKKNERRASLRGRKSELLKGQIELMHDEKAHEIWDKIFELLGAERLPEESKANVTDLPHPDSNKRRGRVLRKKVAVAAAVEAEGRILCKGQNLQRMAARKNDRRLRPKCCQFEQ